MVFPSSGNGRGEGHPWVAVLLMLTSCLVPTRADAEMEQDAGLWILANLQGEVAPQWSLNLEVDVRSFDTFSRTSQLIIQPGVFFNHQGLSRRVERAAVQPE